MGFAAEGDRQTMRDFVQKHGVTMRCQRTDYNPHMEESVRMDHWRCFLSCKGRRTTIVFSMGTGHHGTEPEVAEVLNAMASDASSALNSSGWEDFARDMGMETREEDPDTGRIRENKKAKAAYKSCLREAEQLENLLGHEAAEELMYQTEYL